MKFFGSILSFLEAKMTTPTTFGWYHFLCLAILIAVTVFFCIRFKDASDRTLRRMLFIAWLVLLFTEAYKQLVFTFEYEGGAISSDYEWYSFPFQFCSMPLYVFPFAAFLKDGKLREGILTFISTYILFAGLAVMIYPGDVYISTIGINIQTMVHHGAQVLFGVLLAVHTRRKDKRNSFLIAIAIFSVVVLTALTLNLSVHGIMSAVGMDDTFNMFFISPYYDCTLPVLSAIYPVVPYPVFLLIYILGFSFVAFLFLLAEEGIIRLVKRRHADA